LLADHSGESRPKGGGDYLADVLEHREESGDGERARGAARIAFGAGVAMTRGAADALPWLGALRLETIFGREAGWSIRLDLARGSTAGFREDAGYLGVGYFRGLQRGPFSAHAGWRVAAGPIAQTTDGGDRYWTTVAGTGPWLDASVELAAGVAVGVAVGVEGMLLRRDHSLEGVLWPTAGATIQLRL
jgi:hypothetical protein